jgi:hypothetical protein
MSPGVFVSDGQEGRSRLVLGLGYQVDAALFGLVPIQYFLKKVANCELVHCQNAREYHSMFFCGSISRYFPGYLK